MKDPILYDVPDFFETERLHIRIPRPGDGQSISKAVHESQSHLRPWMQFAVNPGDAEEYEALLRRWRSQFIEKSSFPFVLAPIDDHDTLIGTIGLRAKNWEVPRFEIGYWLHANYIKQGLMTEAVNGLVEYTRTHFDVKRIEIWCDAQNIGSAAVARSAGFTQEAHFHHHTRHFEDDTLRDMLVFAKIF